MDESDISSDSQGEEQEDWQEIDRKDRNRERQKKRLIKKKKKAELVGKMQHIVGIGPIVNSSIDHFMKQSANRKAAESKAVVEYLKYYLDFNKQDISEINIVDTKRAQKDDFIYVALENKEHVREIQFRKAASGNDDLKTRDYIPPQLHARYMGLARKATELRQLDNELKTQIRWGGSGCRNVHKKERLRRTT